jgi:hypothetical protein
MNSEFVTINKIASEFSLKVKFNDNTQMLYLFVNIKELKKDRYNKMFAPLISLQYVNKKGEKVFMTYSDLQKKYEKQTIYLSGLELNDRFKKFDGLAVKIDCAKTKIINEHQCFKYEFCKFDSNNEKFKIALEKYNNSYNVEEVEIF